MAATRQRVGQARRDRRFEERRSELEKTRRRGPWGRWSLRPSVGPGTVSPRGAVSESAGSAKENRVLERHDRALERHDRACERFEYDQAARCDRAPSGSGDQRTLGP